MPHALEFAYDNYNALAVGFGPTERASDAILSVAFYPKWASLFFLQAAGLPDPQGLLQGSGSEAKHIVIADASQLSEPQIAALIDEAVARARVPLDSACKHRLIIKSVSDKQRPRKPSAKVVTKKV